MGVPVAKYAASKKGGILSSNRLRKNRIRFWAKNMDTASRLRAIGRSPHIAHSQLLTEHKRGGRTHPKWGLGGGVGDFSSPRVPVEKRIKGGLKPTGRKGLETILLYKRADVKEHSGLIVIASCMQRRECVDLFHQ